MTVDVCIYGGTAAGVVTAITLAKLKRSVVLVEPGRHLGGMSSGGLGFTDTGNKAAIGGISREFYRIVGKHYGKDEQWTFEPSVAESIYQRWITESGVKVLFEHRLAEVDNEAGKISRILLEHVPADASNAPGSIDNLKEHVLLEAAIFVDATYEGDLLAGAKVAFTVGRESAKQHGESLNGIRGVTPKHQFLVPVDPYKKPGDASSGLLPLIAARDGGTPGDADPRVQTYNFRLCLTRTKENQIPIAPPAGYDAGRYQILARHLDGLVAAKKPISLGMMLKIDRMPRDKTDINNNGAVSTDFIGENYAYATGDYDTRRAIWQKHLVYTQGLLHFLATEPRVPADVRREMSAYGFCRDEFVDTAGWPHQMYVREARRMVGPYVITQAVCEHKQPIDDSIGLASYNMDSHNCQRIVQNGVVRNEGDVQVAPTGPYPISYRAVIPDAKQCQNLLVPVCLSASHIAYGSVRMEPVFMLIGESVAHAADLALTKKSSVQDVDYAALKQRLLDAGQVLAWVGKETREVVNARRVPSRFPLGRG